MDLPLRITNSTGRDASNGSRWDSPLQAFSLPKLPTPPSSHPSLQLGCWLVLVDWVPNIPVSLVGMVFTTWAKKTRKTPQWKINKFSNRYSLEVQVNNPWQSLPTKPNRKGKHLPVPPWLSGASCWTSRVLFGFCWDLPEDFPISHFPTRTKWPK